MTAERIATHSPRLAAWLVELATWREECDAVLGDLAEEFTEKTERDGAHAARRWYWCQAGRTIWQLAALPLWMRPAATAMVALVGISLTCAFGPLTSAVASAVVTRYPVYWYVPAPLFWEFMSATASFLAGFVLAFLAPTIRFRAINAAAAVIAVLGVWLALDGPIVMLLIGPPIAVRVTLASSAARWASGVLTFGGATLVGAVLARMIPFNANPPQFENRVDLAKPMLWIAAVSGALIAAILLGRYVVDLVAPVQYTRGVVTLRSQVTTWSVIAAVAIPAIYGAWRYGRALIGFVVGLAGACIGGIISSIGVMALLVLSQGPTHIRWAGGQALGPFGDALLAMWTLTAITSAVAGLCGRFVLRPLSRRA
jgi:hypothetical protein